jgi:hypothetical protein
MEDVNTHYLASYTPSANAMDGRYRKIEVKVLRSGTYNVQGRSGYFAVPSFEGKPLEPHELAALNALSATPPPREFEFRAAALRVRPGQVTTTFEVPLRNLTIRPIAGGERQQVHASLFALIKDDGGRVVDRISRDLAHEFPTAKLDGFLAGNLTVSEAVPLQPGWYSLESVVIDRLTGKVSTQQVRTGIAARATPELSDIVLVRRLDKTDAAPGPDETFAIPGARITPSLSGIASSAEPVLFFFTAYAGKDGAKPEASILLTRDGSPAGSVVPVLPAPDARGAMPVIASMRLAPGAYEMNVQLRKGAAQATRSLQFRVE